MLAGLMLERMMPSGYCTVCTFTYAMLVVMYLHKRRPCLRPCDGKGGAWTGGTGHTIYPGHDSMQKMKIGLICTVYAGSSLQYPALD